MNAWLLMLVLCVSASAQVVETVRVAAPSVPGAVGAAAGAASAIPTLPPSAVLAPSLGLGAMLGAPQALVHFAPPAAAPASAAVETAPRAEPAPGRAPARKDSVPPSILKAGQAVPSAASFQGQESAGVIFESAPVEAQARGRFSERALPVAETQAKVPVEGASAVGRRVWDQSSEHASLDEGPLSPVVAVGAAASALGPGLAASGKARSGPSGALRDPAFETEVLRDAVASPAAFPSGAFLPRPGASALPLSQRQAPSALGGSPAPVSPAAALPPASFSRLSLELASGLVVRVRSALGLPVSAAVPAGLRSSAVVPRAAAAPRAPVATGAPLTSTEWLERRGLLETLSAVESVAGDVSAAAFFVKTGRGESTAPARPVPSAPLAPAHPALPSPLFWGLAFLPAAAALFREFL